MLRAVRLEQRLEFTIEERTLELLLKARSLLDRVSGDRIRSEFNQIFREAEILAIMDRLSGLALLVAVHPGLTWDDWLRDQWRRALAFTAPPVWEIGDKPPVPFLLYALWVYRLEDSLAPEVLAVLNLPGTERQAIHEMRQVGRQLAALNKQAQPSEVVRVLEGRREMALAAAWLALNDDTTAQSYIDRFLGQWRHVRPNVDGDDLRQLGLPPGPAYGRILDRLRDAWLNGELSNPAEEEQMMAALVAAEESHG
jgi:tRNA nucleotidyltransferase (CCA-adding enzyme)